jgi:hypothetical protein
MNDKKVKRFRCYDAGGNPHDVMVGRQDIYETKSNKVIDIYLSATYHGDHDEFWIVEVLECGKRFHNAKSIDFFELEEKDGI